MQKTSKSAVLFSGGRDSTASAVLLDLSVDEIHLLSFKSGFVMDDIGLRDLRQREMLAANFRSELHFWLGDIRALVREVVLVDLVDDIQTDGCQLVLLGEALCMFSSAIVYAKRQEISSIAYGASKYQSSFPEQQPMMIDAIRGFLAKWDIDLQTPGLDWESEEQPKKVLRDVGLSTKSLESVSMFADIDDLPHPEESMSYFERKLPMLVKYVERSL